MTEKKNKSEMTLQIRQELKELTGSIGKMMGVFKEIRKPIQESFEKVPTTTEHLEKVNKQTEMATHRVLDMVEAITNREGENNKLISALREHLLKKSSAGSSEIVKMLDQLSGNIDASLNDSYSIMDALQFQDITSQQMDHAITLLDDVEDKLISLLATVGMKTDGDKAKNGRKKRVYDPNAKYSLENNHHQDEIDKLISNMD